jgi:hypothetical protein
MAGGKQRRRSATAIRSLPPKAGASKIVVGHSNLAEEML